MPSYQLMPSNTSPPRPSAAVMQRMPLVLVSRSTPALARWSVQVSPSSSLRYTLSTSDSTELRPT
jgi:hypothetical protein